ncbi:RepB family plasmid replication initiator protein [Francisella philomiragia]|uniref:RepB family plasmid replication initiator protein n=1 Tax=Francisella philomiragia TaxID=28110 RepID=UPI003517456B
MTNKNILELDLDKTYYLTSIFSDIKSDTSWEAFDSKIGHLLLSKLSDHKIWLPDLKINNDFNRNEIKELIKKVPLTYTVTREEILDITQTSKTNYSKNIKECINRLLSQRMTIPHPLDKNNINSYITSVWFTDIEVNDKQGTVIFHFNPSVIERLICIAGYTKMLLIYIKDLSNKNAITTYTLLKILLDSYNKKSLILNIEDYKYRLGLIGKYKVNKAFETRVLKVVETEINNCTDIDCKIKLEKGDSGKGAKKVSFDFDYKEKPLITNKTNNNEENNNYFGFNVSNINEDSYFEAILTSWGIRAKKVVEIEESYSIDAINDAIEVTKQAIDSNSIKTTPAAFFIGTLENKELQSQVEFEREQLLIREQQEKERKAALLAEYEAIEKFINDNSDEISKYLSIRSGGGLFNLSEHVKEQLENLSCVDMEKFKDFRSKFVVLEQGFWDMKQRKEIRPTMYQFLKLISFYLAV